LTDVGYARQAIAVRMEPIKASVEAAVKRPTGTSYYGWFERTGMRHWPHNDFFLALGVYGIPGAVLFLVFVAIMMLTVKRVPLGLEKLYARATLTFLLVMGLNITQIGAKYFWVFLAFVLAAERIGWLNAGETEDVLGQTDEETADIDY